jgi:hypothetical protein
VIELDISEVIEAEANAVKEMDRVHKVMSSAVQIGAQFERDHKTYQNRTGDLQRGTRGKLDRNSKEEVVAELIMNTDYASYVKARGFSSIDEASRRTAAQISEGLKDIENKVAK